MCRMMATVKQAPAKAALEEFRALAANGNVLPGGTCGHGDGWGFAGYSRAALTYFVKSADDAAKDTEYPLAVEQVVSTDLCHLRKASKGAVTEANAHPFVRNGLAFCHNGGIKQSERIETFGLEPEGETDSERFFLHITALVQQGNTLKDAARAAIRFVHKNLPYSSICFFLTDGKSVIAYRDFRATVHEGEMPPDNFDVFPEYYTLYFSPTAAAFASQPIAAITDDWQLMDNGELIEIGPGGTLNRMDVKGGNVHRATRVEEQVEALSRGIESIIPMDEFRRKLEQSQKTGRPLRVKLGIDPTAPDIHLGFAVVLRKLRQFQDFGHRIDLVIGDFTSSIGDPTGKSITRPRLTEEEIVANAETYLHQLYKVLDPERTTVHRNSEWLGAMTFPKIIEVTSKFTVARILEREDFTNRLASGQPLHLHEIMYPIAQALDSLHLVSDVEIGGLDQTFNIMAGRDILREYGHEPQVGLFMPLLVGTDGERKMSKSYGNYVGIFEAPGEMFGKTMSIPDEAMPQWYELCTDIPLDEVTAILAGHPMEAKKRLAETITAMYHAPEEASAARANWEKQFSQREVPDDMPVAALSAMDLKDGAVGVARLLQLTGMAKGSNEAKRLITGGGVSLNGAKLTDPQAEIAVKDGDVLKVGRKYAKVVVGA